MPIVKLGYIQLSFEELHFCQYLYGRPIKQQLLGLYFHSAKTVYFNWSCCGFILILINCTSSMVPYSKTESE